MSNYPALLGLDCKSRPEATETVRALFIKPPDVPSGGSAWVVTIVTAMACAFCDIIEGQTPASLVYADDTVVAFLDIHPINPGHVLVAPRAHAACLADLEAETGGHLFQVGKKLAAAVRRSGVRCEGVNLFLADGQVAGQTVFHVHLHVVPRFAGDGFGFRFGPGYGRWPERAALDAVAESIRAEIQA